MAVIITQNSAALQGQYFQSLTETKFERTIEKVPPPIEVSKGAEDPSTTGISQKNHQQLGGIQDALNNARYALGIAMNTDESLRGMMKTLRNLKEVTIDGDETGEENSKGAKERIKEEIKTLDNIAARARIGTKNLLDGTFGITGIPTNGNVSFVSGSAETREGVYTVNVSKSATKGYARTAALATTSVTGREAGEGQLPKASALEFSGELIENGGEPERDAYAVRLNRGIDASQVKDAINNDQTLSNLGIKAELLTIKNPDTGRIAQYLRIQSDKTGAFSVRSQTIEMQKVTGISTEGERGAVAVNEENYDQVRFAERETLRFRDERTGNHASVTIRPDTTIQAAINEIQSELDRNGIGLEASLERASIQLKSRTYGDKNAAPVQIMHEGEARSTNLNLGLKNNVWEYVANGGNPGMGGANGQNVEGDLNGKKGAGHGLLLTGTRGESRGLTLRIAPGTTGNLGKVVVKRGDLTLLAENAGAEPLTILIGNHQSKNLGLTANTEAAGISELEAGTNRNEARIVIDAAILEVNSVIGALENFRKNLVVDTAKALNNAVSNIRLDSQAKEPVQNVREVLEFSRTEILQESRRAMLAQANTGPNKILNLFAM